MEAVKAHEVKEFPPLKAVARERLIKRNQAGKD
jgi:hypothetical protein